MPTSNYMDTLMGLFNTGGSTNPARTPMLDPAGDIRDADPYSSYSNRLKRYGVNTNVMGDQFTDWVNSSGWDGIQADYKSAINANPYMKTGEGGDMYSFLGNQGRGLSNTLRSRYRSMTPQQRGINSPTAFKYGRWAVY